MLAALSVCSATPLHRRVITFKSCSNETFTADELSVTVVPVSFNVFNYSPTQTIPDGAGILAVFVNINDPNGPYERDSHR